MKNTIHILLALFAVAVLASCGGSSSDLSFYNDFENLKPWTYDTSVVKGSSHSGEYAIQTGMPREYSLGFRMKCKEISNKPLKKMKLSVWVNLSDTTTEANLVTQINGVETPNVFYERKQLNRIVREKDKWMEITAEYYINKTEVNKPDNMVLVYIWSKGTQQVLMDDLKVSFEEQ